MSNTETVLLLILIACAQVVTWYFSAEELGVLCLFVAGVCIGFAIAVVWNPWEKNYKKLEELLKLLEIKFNQLQ